MTELALTRSADDRRRYDLDGYGSLRRAGWLSRSAEIRTPDGAVRTTKQSPTGKVASLFDQTGGLVAEYERTG